VPVRGSGSLLEGLQETLKDIIYKST
jgi:hypothetical protein